ncbi:hypothetical protein [Terriglobus sp. TAA 43]|uniref:hypothetical protein n=1 Tax=Terriglobus sp. TAA 43 TaxID=278961 RepID=UPI0012EDE34D|nr:hypothetical protein [Terriglobus sp. TAA 43]
MKTNRFHHEIWFERLFLGFLLLSPLNNSFEVGAMMVGLLLPVDGVAPWAVALTPAYLKVFKDVFLVGALLLLAHAWLRDSKLRRMFSRGPFVLLNIFVVLILFQSAVSIFWLPLEVVLMGVRGYWVLGLVYAGAAFHHFSRRLINKAFVALFVLQIVLQVWQYALDLGYAVYAEHRSPGMFIVPATAGFFALVIYAVAIDMDSTLLKVGALASLLLSNSSSARLVFIVYYMFAYRNKMKPRFIAYPIYASIVALIGLAVALNLGAITGRGEGATESASSRIGIIADVSSNVGTLIFGKGMGIATSQAFISGQDGAIIADNTYVGLIYNAGIVPAIIMLAFILTTYRYFRNKMLFFTLIAYSATTVIFEINPVVQILLIFLGADIGKAMSNPAEITAPALRSGLSGLPERV